MAGRNGDGHIVFRIGGELERPGRAYGYPALSADDAADESKAIARAS
ncbi:hypothetical protein [Streptomyces sp. NPDC041003]